jgi:hypothetical protein
MFLMVSACFILLQLFVVHVLHVYPWSDDPQLAEKTGAIKSGKTSWPQGSEEKDLKGSPQ